MKVVTTLMQSPPWALVVMAICVFLVAEPALAAGAVNLSPVQTILQGIITTLTGPLGKAIATLAVIALGLSWFFGYIDFRQAFMIIVAIAIVAGAATIVATVWGK